MLRRDAWYELGNGYTVAIDKWTADRESLGTALCDTGWFSTAWEARSAAEHVDITLYWQGENADGDLVLCDHEGGAVDGSSVTAPSPISFVDVQHLVVDSISFRTFD